MSMTLRERVACALRGGMPDQIPFTCYPGSAPVSRALEELGAATFVRIPPYRTHFPNVTVQPRDITWRGLPGKETVYTTPAGTLSQKLYIESGYGSQWVKEHFVKEPEDYAVLEFVFRDAVIEPDLDGFREQDRKLGDTGLAVPRAADPPSQELWRRFTGLERFALDWYDCRSEVERVLDALRERNEKIWQIVADMPDEFCASGGNLSGDLVGPAMFDELILPHFQAEAAIMHPTGKRLVNHMDGMLHSLLDSIGKCPVDVVEAFNPSPDGNVSVAEARAAWPEKAILINFPSSIHLAPPERVRQITIELLGQAAPGAGFIVGITENVPASVAEQSMGTIARALNEYGQCPLGLDMLGSAD